MQYVQDQNKIRSFNMLNQCLNNPKHTSRQALKMFNNYRSLGGDISDLKKANQEKVESYLAKSRPDSVNIERLVAKKWLHLETRCKEKGLDFNLRLSDVKKLLSSKKCAYSGEQMFYHDLSTGQPVPDDMITIDRVDCKKGYVRGNVVACKHQWNQIKSHLFEKDLEGTKNIGYSDWYRVAKFLEGVRKKLEVNND